jgi:hypothetical protein
MKKYLLILMIMLAAISTRAQKGYYRRIDSLDHRPLVMVNGKVVDALSFLALDESQFQDFKVISAEQATKKFGAFAGRFGAVQITLFKSAKILTWAELAERFYFIPAQLPAKAILYYGYFGGLELNDKRLYITSASLATGLGVSTKDYSTGERFVLVAIIAKDGDIPQITTLKTPFDKDINAVKKIFDDESKKRIAIENAKPRIEG